MNYPPPPTVFSLKLIRPRRRRMMLTKTFRISLRPRGEGRSDPSDPFFSNFYYFQPPLFLRTHISRVCDSLCETQAFSRVQNLQPLLAAARLRGKFGTRKVSRRKRCVCCAARGEAHSTPRAPAFSLHCGTALQCQWSTSSFIQVLESSENLPMRQCVFALSFFFSQYGVVSADYLLQHLYPDDACSGAPSVTYLGSDGGVSLASYTPPPMSHTLTATLSLHTHNSAILIT